MAKRGKPNTALVGRKYSEEHRKAISRALIGRHLTEDHKKAISVEITGRAVSLETRARIQASLLGVRHTAERRMRQSNAHCTEEGRKASRRAGALGHKACHKRPTTPELQMQSLLENLYPGNWWYVGDGSFIIGHKSPDFLNINGRKAVIEVWGDYWHKGQNPQDRVAHFQEFGFECLVVWEHELQDEQAVIEKLSHYA